MLSYTSMLKQSYNDELEQLMFFNPGQLGAQAAIVDSLEKFGSPSVFEDNGHLRIKVDKFGEVQTLFALDEEILAGVLVFTRESPENLALIYIAVNQDYSSRGKYSKKLLVIRMFEMLRSSAKRIKGVKFIRIMRGDNAILDYSV